MCLFSYRFKGIDNEELEKINELVINKFSERDSSFFDDSKNDVVISLIKEDKKSVDYKYIKTKVKEFEKKKIYDVNNYFDILIEINKFLLNKKEDSKYKNKIKDNLYKRNIISLFDLLYRSVFV